MKKNDRAAQLVADRRALRELACFCLSRDPRALAAAVEDVASTRESLRILSRWLEVYEMALPPRVQ